MIPKFILKELPTRFTEYPEDEIVEYGFMRRPNIFESKKEVHVGGQKNIRLFARWFYGCQHFDYPPYQRKPRLFYGVLKFTSTGEMWIYQNPNRVYGRKYVYNGWQRVLPPDYAIKKTCE